MRKSLRLRSFTAHPRVRGVAIGAGVAAVTALLLFHIANDMDGVAPPAGVSSDLELWTAEALDPTGKVRGAVQICTDATVRDGFNRALPQINGERCLVLGQPAITADLFAAKCVAGGQKYAVNVSRTNDAGGDAFIVRARIQPLYVDHPGALQVLRYRRSGACPPGWRVGEAVNAASGNRYDALDPRGD